MFTACRVLFVERFTKSTNIVLMFTLSVVKVSELEWQCSLHVGFCLLRGLSKSTNIVLMFTLDEGRRKCKRKYV